MSRSSYIIICDIETALLTTKDPMEQIRIATGGASRLCAYLGSNYEMENADVQPLSDIMHGLETKLPYVNKAEAQEACTAIVGACEVLSEKFEPGG